MECAEPSLLMTETNELLVYVGNYPADYVEDDIRKVFKDYIIDAINMQLKQNGRKAFCFLTLRTKEDAKRLVEEMNMKLVDGRRIVVRCSTPHPLSLQRTEQQQQWAASEAASGGEVVFDFPFCDYSKMPALEPITRLS